MNSFNKHKQQHIGRKHKRTQWRHYCPIAQDMTCHAIDMIITRCLNQRETHRTISNDQMCQLHMCAEKYTLHCFFRIKCWCYKTSITDGNRELFSGQWMARNKRLRRCRDTRPVYDITFHTTLASMGNTACSLADPAHDCTLPRPASVPSTADVVAQPPTHPVAYCATNFQPTDWMARPLIRPPANPIRPPTPFPSVRSPSALATQR